MARIGSSDLDVFPMCFGGNVFGWTADLETSHPILDAFVAGGGNFIDTADAYSQWVPGNPGGVSESVLGAWLAKRGNRDRVVPATKVGSKGDRAGLAPENVRAACDESLARLQTDRIDLYYCHRDDPKTPLADTLGALTDLCAREGLSCLPYYSLAAGFLTGKYRTADAVKGAAREARVAGYVDDRAWRVLAAMDKVVARRGISHVSVALAWLLAQPTVVAPIASASRLSQVEGLLGAARVRLAAEDLAELDDASKR